MTSLTITDAAYAQIHNELRSAEYSVPVINLLQTSQPLTPRDGILEATASGASDSTLRDLALAHCRSEAPSIQWSLVAAMYPREDIPADCLVEIRGVWFSFSPERWEMMDGWVLDVSGAGLVLKDADGNVVLPHAFDIGAALNGA